MFLLDPGLAFRNVAGGDAPDDADVFRDRFLGSAGECMKVSVVGVNSAVGTGGGDAGIEGSGSSEGLVLAEGAADDALELSLDSGALGLDVRELGAELVRHLSFHLFSVFRSPVLSFVAHVDCEVVSMYGILSYSESRCSQMVALLRGKSFGAVTVASLSSSSPRDGTEVIPRGKGNANGTHPLITEAQAGPPRWTKFRGSWKRFIPFG